MTLQQFMAGITPSSPGIGYPQPTPSDDTDLAAPYRALDVYATGVVSFVGLDGTTYTTPTIDADWLPYRIDVAMRRVNDTGTTVGAAYLRGVL